MGSGLGNVIQYIQVQSYALFKEGNGKCSNGQDLQPEDSSWRALEDSRRTGGHLGGQQLESVGGQQENRRTSRRTAAGERWRTAGGQEDI